MAIKIAPEIAPKGPGFIEKPLATLRIKDIRMMPLVLALFIIVTVPAIIMLHRGIDLKASCDNTVQECKDQCDVEWEKLLSTLRGNEKFMAMEKQTELKLCSSMCGDELWQCSMESTLFILLASAFGISFFCSFWLISMAKNLMARDEENMDPGSITETHEPQVERISSKRKRSQSQSTPTEKKKRKRKSTKELDKEFEECRDCGKEIAMKYIRTEPPISWTTNCLGAAPVYCTHCGSIQFGFL